MKIEFIKGKRNHYKFPIGFYICKVNSYNNIKTINFRIKHNVYTILINLNKK